MKEDNNEAEEKLITDDSLDNISIEKKHPKKEKLTTVDSLIDSNDKSNQLPTLENKLNEDDDNYDDIIEFKQEIKDTNSSAPKIIFNIKNYVFTFCILFSSFLNYNFLYFPYIILGIFLSFIILRNKNAKFYKIKKISEIIVFIYSILLLIFKIVSIVLIKNDNEWIKNNKNLLINLGVKLLKDEDSTIYLVSSFLSECIIIVISLISFIFSFTFADYKLEDENGYDKKTEDEMFSLLIKYLIINYIIFLCFSILNTSFLTMIYLSLIVFILFFTVNNSELKRMIYLFQGMILLIYIALTLQIFLINLLNCYTFADIIAANAIEKDSRSRYYSFYTQIGIRTMLKNDTLEKRVVHCLSYFISIVAFLSIATTIHTFPIKTLPNKFAINKENKEDNKEEKNICETIKLKIKLFFTSPNFILHICRIFGILYLYYFRNFFAFIVFIWLFFTFIYLHVNSNKNFTYIALAFLYVSYILFHVSNIDGLFEEEEKVYYHFSIYKINDRIKYYLHYLCLNLFIFFNILFIFSINNRESIPKKLEIKDKKIEEQEKKIGLNENLINQENLIKEEEEKEEEIKKDNNQIIEDETDKNKNKDEYIIKDEEKKLTDRRVTLQITEKKLQEEKISRKLKISKEILNKLTLLNIILKAILSHIDKISLIAMYFICINSTNIMHMILVVIFMIQLLFPELIVLISKYLIMIMQVLYLIEFVFDIFKKYYIDNFNNNEKLIKIFMNYDANPEETSVEIYFYIVVYCFYTQYKLYDHMFYKNVISEDKVSLTNFILVKFYSHPIIRNILFFIGKIILEIYIWILIVLFVFFDTYFEISLIFEIKLIIFFIIVFQFLISMQNIKKKYISLILNWIFLGYCSLNSFLVYGYQITCLDYFNNDSESETETESESKGILRGNLPSIGFSIYKDYLYYRFLPHFVCNFISVLFLWEMKRILLRTNIDLEIDVSEEEIIIELENDDNKDEEKEENKNVLKATEIYEQNKKKMGILEIYNYFYNIILMCTKFYWLFLFIYLGIIFTTYDLSIILILYISIFGLIYIRMFYRIITKLNAYIQEKSFFISRLIRYNLVELNRHEQQNKYFRNMGFEYLLLLSLISYLCYYTFGIFHQVQNGCNYEDNNEKWGWQGCDNRHEKLFNDEDNIYGCIAYLIGFYSECDYVFEESWFHLFFAFLICFDVYVLKLEIFLNSKIKKNRQEYKALANHNIELKPLTLGEQNILMNIQFFLNKANIEVKNENLIKSNEEVKQRKKEEEKKRKEMLDNYHAKLRGTRKIKTKADKKIEFKLDIEDEKEDERIGKKLIDDFINIFHKSTKFSEISLSNTNNKYEIVKVVKKVFEEIIIFLLICTSISKMDVWSFIYIIISLILIITNKAMIKFYRLYCFLIISTLFQAVMFVSNIQKSTEPNPDLTLLRELSKKFNVPWYKHSGRFEIDDKMAYFLGLGAAKSQINLIWMEFIEIIIIYIYLDYFSYSIYQEENTIGKSSDKKNELNYFNLFYNKETKEISQKLTEDEYEKHIECMKYNFNVDVKSTFRDLNIFKKFMRTGILPRSKDDKKKENEKKSKDKSLDLSIIKEEKIEEKKEEEKKEEEKTEEKKEEEKKEEEKIEDEKEEKEKIEEEEKLDEDKNIINTEENKDKGIGGLSIFKKSLTKSEMKEKSEEKPSSLIRNITKNLERTKTQKTSLFEQSKFKSKSNKNKCYSKLKDFLFLSFHNVILIFIIIISMMISGFFSVFYITFSLYFLITSTSIYLGNKYLYPKAIRTLLRIIILFDILAQILYQAPFISSGYKPLEIIGLNKILNFTLVQEKSSDAYYEVDLATDQLMLVLAKAFTYLVMSFQVLVYSSHKFQEYYFSYIITKNSKLRRISLMNVFQFNNNRISDMNDAFNLRNETTESMANLKKLVNKWNNDLKNTKAPKTKPKQKLSKSSIEKKEEGKKEKKELVLIGNTKKILGKKKKQDEDKKEEEKKEEEKKEDEDKKEEEKKEEIKEDIKEELKEEIKKEEKAERKKSGAKIFGLSFEFDQDLELKAKEIEEEQDKILPKEEVYKRIKEILLGGFFAKLYLKIDKHASSYMTIKKNEKDFYEYNTIKGESKMVSFIENQVDMQLGLLDLTNFSSREMKEVVKYLDGSRKKKLKEKEKEKKKKLEEEKKEKKKIKSKKNIEDIIITTEEKDIDDEIINEKDNKDEKKKEKIIDLNDPKFQQFETFTSTKLFMKYLSKRYLLKCIFREIFSFFLNNFHWICYLVMIINHLISASLLTLPYPLSIFFFAILEYPRPRKNYWKIVLLYTVFLLIIKFVIHIEVLRSNDSFNNFITTLYNYKIGVRIYKSSFSKDFFIYILYDALVLIFLLINEYLLVSRGIFLKREQEIEDIYQANERIAKKNLLIQEYDIKKIQKFNNDYLEPKEEKTENEDNENYRFSSLLSIDGKKDIKLGEEKKLANKPDDYNKLLKHLTQSTLKGRTLSQISTFSKIGTNQNRLTKSIELLQLQKENYEKQKKEKEKYDESARKYYERLFPRIRNEKPGNEFYAWYTVSLALIMIYVLIFYTSMVQDKTFGAVELDTKQFSGEMVIVLVIHVAILVYDRVLYINQNRKNLKFKYIFYDRKTGTPIDEKILLREYNNDGSIIPPKKLIELKEKYNIINIQTEEFNTTIFQKYILHLLITLFSHIFIFFYCPMIGNNNIFGSVYCPKDDDDNKDDEEDEEENQCNDFVYNKTLIFCYLLYVIYLISSGMQIKYGFYDMKRKSMLKSGDKSINAVIYNIYKAIPFLYEIKLAIDWTFTKTCLGLFQWNKFESVYDVVYVTFCQMNAKNKQLVGQKIGKISKIFWGGFLAFFLIILLIFPLMLFSSLNPTNKINNVTGAVLKVDLCFFYKNKAVKNYTLYENTRPETIDKISDDDMILYNYSSSVKTKNFDKEQIQTVQFFPESDKNWDLANPLIDNLKELIKNRKNNSDLEYIALAIDYNFDRPLPIESNKINKRYIHTIYYYNNYSESVEYEYIDELGQALEYCYDVEITYKSIYSPPVRLSSNIKPKRLLDPKYFPNLDAKLGFVGCKNVSNGTDTTKNISSYLESYFTFEKVMKRKTENNEEEYFDEGIKFHVFSDKVSSTTSGKSILTIYISFVLMVGNYVRNFFAGQPEKIMLTEMPYCGKIIDLCEGIKISRNSFDFKQEEELYYRLIELMRSPEYLRSLTMSSTEQFKKRKEMTKVNKTTDGV